MKLALAATCVFVMLASCAEILGIEEATIRDASFSDVPGVECNGTVCEASIACCLDTKTCQHTTACFGGMLKCDSYATCPGQLCCLTARDAAVANSICSTTCPLTDGGALMCRDSETCPKTQVCTPILVHGVPGYSICQ